MNHQYSLILAVSFMIFYNVVSGFNYTDCGSEPGKLKYILVKGCYTDCKLKIGTNVEVIVVFNVPHKVTDVTVEAFVPVPIFYQLALVSGCKNNGLKCPLEIGNIYKYKGVLKVSETIPKMYTYVRWRLIDQSNNPIVCALFDVQFV